MCADTGAARRTIAHIAQVLSYLLWSYLCYQLDTSLYISPYILFVLDIPLIDLNDRKLTRRLKSILDRMNLFKNGTR